MAEAETGLQVVDGEVGWVIDGSLEVDEQIIERGLSSFVEVGAALQHIRDRHLYRSAGFDTFEAYCQKRWDLASRTARQKIDAARVVEVIGSGAIAPVSEMATRPFVKILNEDGPEAVETAWSQILEARDSDRPPSHREVSRFFSVGGNYYGKAGWHELLGEMGDLLIKAEKQLSKVEAELTRKPSADFADKADRYAMWASHLADRLRALKDGPA